MDGEKLDIQIQTTGVEQTTQELNQLTAALAKVSTQIGKLSKNLTRSLSALTRFANAANGVTRKVNGSSDINKTVEQTRKLTAILKSKNPNLNMGDLANLETEKVEQTFYTVGEWFRKNISKEIPEQTAKSVKNITKNVRGLSKETNRSTNSIQKWTKTLWNLGKIAIMARAAARAITSFVRESGAWIENLNLFAVTFGNNYEETLDWALEFSERLGVANNEIVKMTGLFKQLSTSIGISDQVGDDLSKTLTQLSYDFASFYNITDVSTAAEKLQAGIFSGQIRTLRSLGIDVSQESVENMLKTNEALSQFNLSARQLSQSQKVIARTILTLEAGKNAFGDIGRSIDTLENRIRVLKGSWSNLKLAIGDLFSDTASDIAAYAIGVIQSITSIIRAVAPIKTELSYDVPDNVFTEISEDAENANDSVNQLSFDKFETLTSSEAENLQITELLTQELQRQQEEYDKIAEQASRIDEKVQEVKQGIMGWIFPSATIEQIREIVAGLGDSSTMSDKINAVIAELNPILRAVVDTGKKFFDLMKDLAPQLAKVGKVVLDIATFLVDILDKTKLLYPTLLLLMSLKIYSKLKAITGISFVKFFTGIKTGIATALPAIQNIASSLTDGAFGKKAQATMTQYFYKLTEQVQNGKKVMVASLDKAKIAAVALKGVMAGIFAFQLADSFFGQFEKEGKVIAGVIGTVAAVLTGLAVAAAAAVGYLSWGTALVAIGAAVGVAAAGIKAMVEGANEMKGYENGGIPAKSELFYMNENGVPEALINTGGSQTNVINQSQLRYITKEGFKEAIYETGLLDALSERLVLEGRNINDSAFARAIFPALKTESKRQGGNQL